jgi:hypothetical protein
MPLLAGLLALSCSKDPDVVIHEKLEFDQCLAPIQVDFDVNYVEISVSCGKIFPDAEKYELEVSREPFPMEGEPAEEDIIRREFITLEEDVPYTFTGPDETACYLRIRAVNETEGKKPSRWVSGYVMTGVDPETTCGKPSDAKAVANFTSVTFSWTPAENVKEYILEVYNDPLPGIGEPDESKLNRRIVKLASEIPFVEDFMTVKRYYYRVRGTNEEDGLKPSGWQRGSFDTQAYTFPTNHDAFDYGYTHARPRTSIISVDAFAAAGWQPGVKLTDGVDGATCTVDGITYGPGVTFEDEGGRVTFAQCNKWDKNYTNNLCTVRYVKFNINRPGSVSFIPRLSGSTAPELVVGLMTTKQGSTQFKYLYREKIVITSTITQKNEENRVTVEIPNSEMMGIDDMATVYIFSNITKMSMYPITWTPE